MGLFDKVFCTSCKEEAKLLTRLKLQDGNYLCTKCKRIIPSYMMSSVRQNFDFSDYQGLLNYIEYSNEHLRPLYRETHRYSSIGLDSIHGLFHLEYSINSKTVFLDAKNVTYFDLVFEPEEIKEGIIGTKVKGDVRMVLEMDTPSFAHGGKVAYGEKAKAKKSLFGGKITYETPANMSNFLAAFLSCCIRKIEAEYSETFYEEDQDYAGSSATDLQRAMTLFMLDDLDNVTLDKVKMQRNRLMKTFHPDKGSADDTNYAQKINAAYEVLKNYLNKGDT